MRMSSSGYELGTSFVLRKKLFHNCLSGGSCSSLRNTIVTEFAGICCWHILSYFAFSVPLKKQTLWPKYVIDYWLHWLTENRKCSFIPRTNLFLWKGQRVAFRHSFVWELINLGGKWQIPVWWVGKAKLWVSVLQHPATEAPQSKPSCTQIAGTSCGQNKL